MPKGLREKGRRASESTRPRQEMTQSEHESHAALYGWRLSLASCLLVLVRCCARDRRSSSTVQFESCRSVSSLLRQEHQTQTLSNSVSRNSRWLGDIISGGHGGGSILPSLQENLPHTRDRDVGVHLLVTPVNHAETLPCGIMQRVEWLHLAPKLTKSPSLGLTSPNNAGHQIKRTTPHQELKEFVE
jgi:hypothetical protein